MKRIPSLRTNRAEREGSGRQQQEPRRSVTYSRSIRPNESKRAGNGNARNRGENPFAGNALSFVLRSITTSESATTTTCPAACTHNGQPNQKCIAAESSSINGRGGEEVKGSPRPRLFLFLIQNRFSCLVLVGFPLSTFVCVCPVVVTSSSAFEERGDVQTTKEKGLSLFPGVD